MIGFDVFTAYAMEMEGDLPTRQGKINKLINTIVENIDADTENVSISNCDIDDLSPQEIEYIRAEVAQRARY